MPFREVSRMEEKLRFVSRALEGEENFSCLCRESGISRKTGYLVLERYKELGEMGLIERSHRPHHSPNQIPGDLERAVISLRGEHPGWGPRKLSAYLEGLGKSCPKSTIGRVLRRNGLIDPQEAKKHTAWKTIKSDKPNRMWQTDFTDFRLLGSGCLAHALGLLDDASRFLIALRACANERRETVEEVFTLAFRTYGLPDILLSDNGVPWGSCGLGEGYTKLSVWLIRLGVKPVHARVRHPQTIGKVERFNRTLKSELGLGGFWGLYESQRAFDSYVNLYNFERPHQALGMAVPASVYEPSPRPYPEKLEEIDYDQEYLVRKVGAKGEIYFKGREFLVGRAFHGLPVGLLLVDEGSYDIYFMRERVARIHLSPDT
jgi:transposase InsO family protein